MFCAGSSHSSELNFSVEEYFMLLRKHIILRQILV